MPRCVVGGKKALGRRGQQKGSKRSPISCGRRLAGTARALGRIARSPESGRRTKGVAANAFGDQCNSCSRFRDRARVRREHALSCRTPRGIAVDDGRDQFPCGFHFGFGEGQNVCVSRTETTGRCRIHQPAWLRKPVSRRLLPVCCRRRAGKLRLRRLPCSVPRTGLEVAVGGSRSTRLGSFRKSADLGERCLTRQSKGEHQMDKRRKLEPPPRERALRSLGHRERNVDVGGDRRRNRHPLPLGLEPL
jgi:hypothetical protein